MSTLSGQQATYFEVEAESVSFREVRSWVLYRSGPIGDGIVVSYGHQHLSLHLSLWWSILMFTWG